MQITHTTTDPDTTLAHVEGRFDVWQIDVFDGWLLRTTTPTVIIDLSRVTFIDYSMISMLERWQAEFERAGRSLMLSNPSRTVEIIMSLTHTALIPA